MNKYNFTDALQRNLSFHSIPERIISLVPSLTETLFDLGLSHSIIGRTKFCIHPKGMIDSVPKVGGTKNVHINKIQVLNPDLIVANIEENTKEEIEMLCKNFTVYISDIKNISDLTQFIRNMGNLFNKRALTEPMISEIMSSFHKELAKQHKVVYLIWNLPMMTVGHDTFIHHMLLNQGFVNVFGHLTRYPVISEEDIRKANPDYIFLSSEPFPFYQKHIETFTEKFDKSRTVLVDGEAFSWYGTRILKLRSYFEHFHETLT
ncbi:MAG TPA: helical backbone metal receptor [Saprospiraceae bacterium]|nr:helical backbone metal receptor [Saprospiraceae bacterium]